ncbi:hypothetical protein Fot_07018 [Forsythia ovata]|uniref:Uncharacterized protein n=1 Tax=Forsythia ovata TaxID=205694 RepID=A0ABD1WUP7_9LAMI
MGSPTFMQANDVELPPKQPDPVIIDDVHQPPSIHHTFVGLTPPKWDPIDLQNRSTAAILIRTISAPANSGHQRASDSIPSLGGRLIASILADNNPKMNLPRDACYTPPQSRKRWTTEEK